ncbi:MAG TPA: HAMP domain-containing sensor histidine kinase [Vicinamibacterales bacterium]|nr:HAMP domain-containing sensor histidine kinase [Vicinamibacterales bacterium]
MAGPAAVPLVRWYRSLYFRIGVGFVTFVFGLLLLQELFLAMRPRPPLRGAPNTVVALVAADLTLALSNDPRLDIDAYLKRQYAQSQPIYTVMKNGTVASNRSVPLADDLRRYAMAIMSGRAENVQVDRTAPMTFVTAPVQMGGTLAGVVLLPPGPPPGPPPHGLDRLTILPSTILLVGLTVIAAAVIFEPVRRRMQALRSATQRLGAGDFTARAPVSGFDEVAELSATFNAMADELTARDEALRRSDLLRRQMLADVSHELKTPLAAMRGYVETLHRDDITLDAETRERYFQILERETDRLDRLVKDLLDLARVESGATAFDIRVFAIERLFEHVVHRHEQACRQRRVTVRVHVDDAADQMVADPHRIEQVIENLFANALRHTPDDGLIELAARVDGTQYVLTVADSGSGIAKEHLPYVFERFYKVDASRRKDSEGSGLGLSIGKAIVDRHGGTMAVDSRAGRTVFTMRFPLARDEAAGEPPQVASTNL